MQELLHLGKTKKLSVDTFLDYRHGAGTYWMYQGDLDAAQKILQQAPPPDEKDTEYTPFSRVWGKHILAQCLRRKDLYVEAQECLEDSLQRAREINYQRAIIFNQVELASLFIDVGQLEKAEPLLQVSLTRSQDLKDWRYFAEAMFHQARLHTVRGERDSAVTAFASAIDLFERLGMRRELAKAREELRRLDELGEAPAV